MMITILLLTLCLQQGQSLDPNETLLISNMSVSVEELLDKLCPSVDICNLNASNAELTPNGLIGENIVSCCTGCSCHQDCKERSNCCYQNRTYIHRSIEQPTSRYECLNFGIGKHGEALPESIEAYHTVTQSPAGGCIAQEPVEIESGLTLKPVCHDDPSGSSFFPVYSKTKREIYRTVQCAMCHGVADPQYFTPVFICRLWGRIRTDPFSEISYLIDNDKLPSRCHIDFRFHEPRLLSVKRCYQSVIDTCQEDKVYAIPGLDIPSLDLDVVGVLCETGVYSPFPTDFGVYKNVFCYLCGHHFDLSRYLECRNDGFERSDDTVFISILDPRAYLRKGDSLRQDSYPKACLDDKDVQDEIKCHRIYCPLGKTMTKNGQCVFTSTYITSPLHVHLKLIPEDGEDFRLLIRSLDIIEFRNLLIRSTPWSNEWIIRKIYIRRDDFICKEKANILVDLISKMNSLTKIVPEMEHILGLPWKLVINGTVLAFKQSLREYDLRGSRTVAGTGHIDNDYLGCDSVLWKTLFSIGTRSNEVSINISKLYFCLQIQVQANDLNLIGPKPSYLIKNVTNRVLSKHEFELIRREDGYDAKVCLEDTILKQQRCNSVTRQGNVLAVLMCCLLYALCTASLKPTRLVIKI